DASDRMAEAFPGPSPAAAKSQKHGLQRVVVPAPNGFQPDCLGNRARDFVEAPAQPVVRPRFARHAAEFQNVIHETIDLAIAIKWEWPPWSIEVTPLQKLLRRTAEDAARSFPIGTLAPAQKSEHGFAGIAEHLFEPSVERRLEHRVGRIFGADLEHRIYPPLDRPLAPHS